jgi:hypothetical protein
LPTPAVSLQRSLGAAGTRTTPDRLCFLPLWRPLTCKASRNESSFLPFTFCLDSHPKSLSGLSLLLLVRQLILCVLFFLKPPSIQLFQHFTSAFPRLAHLLLFLEQSDASSLYPIVKATHIQLIAFPTAQYLDSIPIRLFCSQTLAFHSDHVRLGRR